MTKIQDNTMSGLHQLYYEVQACDNAWQQELVRAYGRLAGDARYDARGYATDNLRRLRDAYHKASANYIAACHQSRQSDTP